MKLGKQVRRTMVLSLVVLLLGCTSTADSTPTGPPPPTDAPPPPPPTATTAPLTDIQPLNQVDCVTLANALEETLQVEPQMTQAPFEDFVHQKTGTGCLVAFYGTELDFESVGVAFNNVRKTIHSQGWVEDFRYGGGGATGLLTGYRLGNKLCHTIVGWEPSDAVDCPADQPLFTCDIPPEQKLYTVSLNCIQDTTLPVHSPVEPVRIQFPPDGTTAQVTGSLAPGEATRYVLTAMAGQEMTVIFTITSDPAPAEMSTTMAVWGADGATLTSGFTSPDPWILELVSSQDYTIDLLSVTQDPIDYTLEIFIPPSNTN